ncbi:hypothetical protein AMC86_PB00197 (plasmid) [Rhizobium phaseoli]|nr:hypothetical protein AMC86_PB00197 [Rhizobium phaseoli]
MGRSSQRKDLFVGFQKVTPNHHRKLPNKPNVADQTKPTDGVVMASLAPLGRPRLSAGQRIRKLETIAPSSQSKNVEAFDPDLPLTAIRASAVLNRSQTLDHRMLEFSGFIQGGGLVAPPEFTNEIGTLLPIAP